MSLVPVLYDELSDPFWKRRWDQIDWNLRREIRDLDALTLSEPLPLSLDVWRYPRWNRIFNHLGTTTADKNKFKVRLDVDPFLPHEVTVKTCDNQIVVEGKHEERRLGNNHITRQFTRRYSVPEAYDIREAKAQLSSDGIVTVEAPRQWWRPIPARERVLYVERTGPNRWLLD